MLREKQSTTANTKYMTNGVAITPASPTTGEEVKVIYDGLLAKSGANHVLAHVGFGNSWCDIAEYRMERTGSCFETTIPVKKGDAINICFKDCAGNWDNNSGLDYSFDVN